MGWAEFIKDFNIPSKAGSAGENIEIHCPFCGDADRGMHMSVHMLSPRWACWRNRAQHKGRDPGRLIRVLLKCSYDQAESLADSYFENLAYYRQQVYEKHGIKDVTIPQDFIEFKEKHDVDLLDSFQQVYVNYLRERDISPEFVTARYDLRWAFSGEYANRVIIPSIHLGRWGSWTGRAITAYGARYKACQINSPDSFLFDFDSLVGGKALFITEGSFDAMKITSCFLPEVSATALTGKNISSTQVLYLTEIEASYEKIYLALDADAYKDALYMADQMRIFIPKIKVIKPRHKDFGSTPLADLRRELLTYL